jgi:hypothetical protein
VDKQQYKDALNEFYKNYIVDTVNGSFQIFQSFTYGELVISFLLALIVMLFILKWAWEVIR